MVDMLANIVQIATLIPSVLSYLKDNNQYDIFFKFMNLLADRKMPLDNIAYQLFVDAVNFYSCQDKRLMRYNDVTKKFWFIGRKLFHTN